MHKIHANQNSQKSVTAKDKALRGRTAEIKMRKVHSSTEYCAHCGEKISRSERHESGHREFDHVDVPGPSTGVKIVR